MVKLADTASSKGAAERREGSSPSLATKVGMMTKEERIAECRVIAEKQKQECEEAELKHWNNLPRIEKREDVPPLPKVEEKEWKEFYVPRLIEAGAIPLVELKDGMVYEGRHRDGKVARWDAEEQMFTYPYWEWNQKTTMKCQHFEMDDGFALFVPLKRVAGKEVDLLTFL